jgi:hypothetical protein
VKIHRPSSIVRGQTMPDTIVSPFLQRNQTNADSAEGQKPL